MMKMSIQNKIMNQRKEENEDWTNSLFYAYAKYLKKSDKGEQTKDWELKNVSYYLQSLNGKTKITKESIYDYINSLNDVSRRTIHNWSICIKNYINWLYEKKNITFNGNEVFPKLHKPESNSMLSYYANKEIKQVLNSIDNKTPNGKRNLAMFTIATYLGLRREDIRTLKLESIDWNNDLINICQSKNSELITLPLFNEIRYALLDYLKNARPDIISEYVFIQKDGTLYSENYLSTIFNDIFSLSGIDLKERKYSCHTLRHSLATNMLANKKDMHVISKALGHSNTDITKNVYITYDENKLRELSLEVPAWN